MTVKNRRDAQFVRPFFIAPSRRCNLKVSPSGARLGLIHGFFLGFFFRYFWGSIHEFCRNPT